MSTIEFIPVSTITLPLLKAYALASGDYNTIHQDEAAAKAAGLPGVIAHGMFIASLVGERGLKWMRERFPDGNFDRQWKPSAVMSRFRAMTFLGDTVSVGGTVKTESESQMILELQAKNQKGEILTTARFSFFRQ